MAGRITAERKRRRLLLLAVGGAAICTGPLALWAQDMGGLHLTYGIDSRITGHSNLDLEPDGKSSTLSDTRLTFGLRKSTQSVYLDLQGSALLREQLSGSSSDKEGLINPNISLSFGHENASSGISGGLFYRETDLGSSQELDDFDESAGTRRDRGGNLALIWGGDSRILWRLGADAKYADYSDSPGSNDYKTLTYSGGAALALNETTTLDLGLSRTDYDRDGQARRTTDMVTTNLRMARPDGILSFGATFADTPEGNRETAFVSRDYDLSDGSFSARIGVSRSVAGHTGLIGDLSYSRELPNGALSLSLSRELTSSSETDSEVEETRANASLSQTLTDRIGISMNLGLAKQSYTEGSQSDVDRMIAGLSASYDLGQDWQATAGISHTSRKEDGETERDSSFYIGVRKTFQRDY